MLPVFALPVVGEEEEGEGEQESEVEDRRVMVGREARKRGREGLSHDCKHTNKSGTIMLLFVVVGGRAQRYSAAVFLS
jgi:hypothetical protein